ncbi:MAG: hypothetical protein QOH60_608 [Mycobacterium sp.]|jgi:hypothetical protein|nr:hypothetical protein [Mycobacterium sp.]
MSATSDTDDPALTDLKERINSALCSSSATSTVMARHNLWVVRGMMDDIDPEADLSAAEILAILAVLAPVHARVLSRSRRAVDASRDQCPVGPPTLRVIRG